MRPLGLFGSINYCAPGYNCPPYTPPEPAMPCVGVFTELWWQWRTGDPTPYELPVSLMTDQMDSSRTRNEVGRMLRRLKSKCVLQGRHGGLMSQIAFDQETSAGSPSDVWCIGSHQRTLTGYADCCSRKVRVCFEITDRFDFDESDPWPSGDALDKCKYLGSICTGAILNFPNPWWSYVSVPVHGKICRDYDL